MVRYKKRRQESYVEAGERISRAIKKDYRPKNLNDFLAGYSDYMGVPTRDMSEKEKKFKELVVDIAGYKKDADEEYYKKAGGKDLKGDRGKTAKVVVTDEKVYRKKGVTKVDLKGFDTKRRLEIPAKKKGKIVYAERTFIQIRGKHYMRFRDRKGHFVSVRG